MKIVGVYPNASYIKARLDPLPGEGRFKLTVTATMDTPYGRSQVPIGVRTDLEKAGTLYLTLIVDRGIITAPPTLFLGLLPRQMTGQTTSVVTISRPSGAFHVTNVTVDDAKVQARLETVRDGHEYRVVLTYSGGWEVGAVRRTVSVTTDDARQPVLNIPLEAEVRIQAAGAAAGTAY